MPPNQKNYSDVFRAKALAMVKASTRKTNWERICETANKLEMPARTLRSWVEGANPVDEDLLEMTENAFIQAMGDEIRNILELLPEKRDRASYRDLAIALGILTDKVLLLSGEPTENTRQTITFERTGLSTLPEHLPPRAITGPTGDEEVQRGGLRQTLGEDPDGAGPGD